MLGTATLRPGERATIQTELPIQRESTWTRGVMLGRDVERTTWAWDIGGKPRRRLKVPRRFPPASFHPDAVVLRAFFRKPKLDEMPQCQAIAWTDRDLELGRTA